MVVIVNRGIKIILKSVSYMIIIVVVSLAILLVGVKMFGFKIYTVLSGSMEPEYRVGSLIYVVDTNINELDVGDVITFNVTNKVVATHRIVEIEDDLNGIKFRTKGDANDFIDENYVESSNVIGTPMFMIPYLGYVASFMQTKSGKFITIGISILLIIIVIVIDSIIDNKKEKIKENV